MAAKTKSVGGTEYPVSDFAYVGDPQDISTWHLCVADAAHVRDAMARFGQTQLPADAKAKVAKKLMTLAKKFGIDASGFGAEHGMKTMQAAAAEQSFEELQQELDEALLEKWGRNNDGCRQYSLCETFPDYLIARGPDGELYQISYSEDEASDTVTFGEPQQVETAYVPVQESARFMAAAASEDGLTWPIQVMESGFANGHLEMADPRLAGLPHFFPKEVVAQVAEACNNARFGRRHPATDAEETDPSRVAGYLDSGRMSGSAAHATLHLFENEKDIQGKLMAAKKADKLDLFGASILAYFSWRPGKAEGRDAMVAQKLGRLVSVDLVTEAGAGGKVLAYAASKSMLAEIAAEQRKAVIVTRSREAANKVSPSTIQGEGHGSPRGAGRNLGGTMKESILKVLEALRKIDAGRATELAAEFETCPAEKQFEFFAKVSEAVTEKLPAAVINNAPQANAAAELLRDAAKSARDGQNADVMAKTREALDEVKKVQFTSTLERKLKESKLPVPAASLVREHFANPTGAETEAQVDIYIGKVRESFAAFASVGRTAGSVEVGRDSRDKVQLAMDAMFRVKEAAGDHNVKPFRGIQEAYIVCTGDKDLAFDQGGFYRTSEAIAAADFPNILLNSMTKKLIQDYNELAINDALNVLFTTSVIGDYKSQDRVRMGYLGDLSTVAEAGVYTELTKPTDEKISYAVSKKGNLVTISEETIRNDDLRKVADFPSRLARAARHTLAAAITTPFITPPNYDPDGIAWFHATHANLGSTGLSSTELDVRKIALYKQSEKDSTNRLGLRLWGIMVPADLEPTARQINNNMSGTNNWYQQFGVNGERIIVNPLLVDVTDWYYFCDPKVAPFLEVGFLDGYQTPQIFLANLQTQGTQFTNDQVQFKAKFVFGVKPIDFRGVGKEVVTG